MTLAQQLEQKDIKKGLEQDLKKVLKWERPRKCKDEINY